MPTTFFLEKEITVSDFLTKTSIKIEKHNGDFWVIDEHKNSLLIEFRDSISVDDLNFNENKIKSLTRYGMNNPSNILDIIINTLKIEIITDEDIDEMFYNDSKTTK
jgi:hypothetical protein